MCVACISRIQGFLGSLDDPPAKEGCFQSTGGACKEDELNLSPQLCVSYKAGGQDVGDAPEGA